MSSEVGARVAQTVDMAEICFDIRSVWIFVIAAANEKAIPDPTRKNCKKKKRVKHQQSEVARVYTYEDLVSDRRPPHMFAERLDFARSRDLITKRWYWGLRVIRQKPDCARNSMTRYTGGQADR
jgi:hypothetical protein